uniref:Chromate transporter n=1 Tax=Ascaris lumbricoides TaxID=6252 RepID=A0A0M3IG28_ASCLU
MNETGVGFVACIISCIAFGFMFTPLRKFDSRDGYLINIVRNFPPFQPIAIIGGLLFTTGFFVQWVECSMVFVVGYLINIVRNFPPFQPIAIIGGLLFTTGK